MNILQRSFALGCAYQRAYLLEMKVKKAHHEPFRSRSKARQRLRGRAPYRFWFRADPTTPFYVPVCSTLRRGQFSSLFRFPLRAFVL